MFLPLSDDNRTHPNYRPYVTHGLVAASVLVFFLFQSGAVFALAAEMAVAYGLIPSVFMGRNVIAADVFHVPALVTPLTYLFLHGSWLHLVGNMLFLWVFGDNIEADMGRWRYLAFYLAAGAASGVVFALFAAGSDAPLIGASGAVSAVLGAYLVLHPNVKVFGLMLNIVPMRIPALWFIGGWFVFQVGHALFSADQGVAWVAHIVGLVVGALGVAAMKLPQIVRARRQRRPR